MGASNVEFRDPAARAASSRQADSAGELRDLDGERWSSTWALAPSTHGVLRILLELDGEIITKAMPDIGHRTGEKDRQV
jgi:NADH-quinone oxidoreductase subunit D